MDTVNTTNKKHKHYDLIIAWANGAEIEVLCFDGIWMTLPAPSWEEDYLYRIKPQPKPDIVMYGDIYNRLHNGYESEYNLDLSSGYNITRSTCDNIKLTYSGETMMLTSIEMIETK